MLLWTFRNANSTMPTNMSAENPEKFNLFSNVFLAFLSIKTFFFEVFFGTRFGNLPGFCAKHSEFQSPIPKTNKQKIKFSHKKYFFSANCSSDSVECWFDNPDGNFGRKFENFQPNCRFWIFFSKIFLLEIILWTCILQFGSPALIFWQKNFEVLSTICKTMKESTKNV